MTYLGFTVDVIHVRQALTEVRLMRGWSLEDVYLRCSVGASNLRDFEAGRRSPSRSQAIRWAKAVMPPLEYAAEKWAAEGEGWRI